jgi:AcrR family transcriptional regulator
MFAARGFECVTIADIAGEADVAVQTVFNHFATKEELFFDGRTPAVDGPANAVRNRPPGVSPLAALREHLVREAASFVALQVSPEAQDYTAAIDACPALAAYERRMMHESERLVEDALAEAWATDPEPGTPAHPLPAPEIAAALAAAIWMGSTRVVVVHQRRLSTHQADPAGVATAVEELADGVLAGIEAQLGLGRTGVQRSDTTQADTGWPRTAVRRAG